MQAHLGPTGSARPEKRLPPGPPTPHRLGVCCRLVADPAHGARWRVGDCGRTHKKCAPRRYGVMEFRLVSRLRVENGRAQQNGRTAGAARPAVLPHHLPQAPLAGSCCGRPSFRYSLDNKKPTTQQIVCLSTGFPICASFRKKRPQWPGDAAALLHLCILYSFL